MLASQHTDMSLRPHITRYTGAHHEVKTVIISEVIMGIRPLADLNEAFNFGEMLEGHAYWQGIILDDLELSDETIGKLSLLIEEVDIQNA